MTVYSFPFQYNTPGLDTGVQVFVPTPGQIITDAWFETDTVWNGATPRGDFGNFVGAPGTSGLFGVVLDPVDMTTTGAIVQHGMVCANARLNDVSATQTAALFLETTAGTNPVPLTVVVNAPIGSGFTPLHCTTADPILVCVSQDGTLTGGDPGATQGSAVFYLEIATP